MATTNSSKVNPAAGVPRRASPLSSASARWFQRRQPQGLQHHRTRLQQTRPEYRPEPGRPEPGFLNVRHILGVGVDRAAPGELVVDRSMARTLGQLVSRPIAARDRFGVQGRPSVVVGHAGVAQTGSEDLQQHAQRDRKDCKGDQHFQQRKPLCRRLRLTAARPARRWRQYRSASPRSRDTPVSTADGDGTAGGTPVWKNGCHRWRYQQPD